MMKKTVFLICFIFVANAFAGIVATADNANKFTKKAEADLTSFLTMISGEKWTAVPEKNLKKSGEKVIYLGDTAFARSKNIKTSDFADEEWCIRSFSDGMVITGGNPIGTFYGACDLLNKIGVRFLTPDETYVPQIKNFKLPDLNIRKKPSFESRLIYDSMPNTLYSNKLPKNEWEKYFTHRLRTGNNGSQSHRLPAPYVGEYMRRTVGSISHTYVYYVNFKDYFDKHPEYYTMDQNGKRVKSQLCFSNKKVWEVMLKNLRKYIKRDRIKSVHGLGVHSYVLDKAPTVYMISQMDGSNDLCFCPECKKIAEVDGDAGLQLRCLNYVAKEIAKEYPDIKIATLAYCSTDTVPKITKPEKNIIFQFCDLYVSSDCYRPINSKYNAQQQKKLDEWLKFAPGQIAIYDYWNMGGKNYFNPPRQEVCIDGIIGDLKYYHKNNIKLFFTEGERDFTVLQPFFEMHYYVAAALLMDINADTEKLMDEYVRHYYGEKAYPIVKSYLQTIRKGVAEHPSRQATMLVNRWNFCTPEFLYNSYMQLKKAEKLSDGTRYQKRIQELIMPILWEVFFYRKGSLEIFINNNLQLDALKKECLNGVTDYIRKLGGVNAEKQIAEMTRKFEYMFIDIPIDDKFKGYSVNDIKVFGYPHCKEKKPDLNIIVDDPDSPVGKAVKAKGIKTTKHGVKAKDGWVWASLFAIHDGRIPRGTVAYRVKKIPQDEKYHWYKIPQPLNCVQGFIPFWGLYGYLNMDLSTLYRYVDGRDDMNIWDIYFSVKFTGPAWVKGSKKENAVYLDRIVAVWHYAKPLQK